MTFSLFGYDVEITMGFWLTALLLSLPFLGTQPMMIVVWALVLLVSVLVHELGHAVAMSAYGMRSSIRLHFMGGVTIPHTVLPLSRRSLVITYLAGPLAGFLLAGVSYAVAPELISRAMRMEPLFRQLVVIEHPGLATTVFLFFQANFFWSLLNLVPVLPLDGGHILEHILGPKRYRWTLGVSALCGGAAAVYFGMSGSMIAAFILGSAALQSFLRLRDVSQVVRQSGAAAEARRAEGGEEELHPDLERDLRAARRALDDERFDEASTLARAVTEGRSPARVKPSLRALREALGILGWAELGAGRIAGVAEVVERMSRGDGEADPALAGAVALDRGDRAAARALFEAARVAGDDRKEVFGPLIQILIQDGEAAVAAAVALDSLDGLSSADARIIATNAADAGADIWSGRLLEGVFERDRVAEDGFEAARSFARAGDPERALSLLRSAVAAGFSDAARAYSDAELGKLALENILRRPS